MDKFKHSFSKTFYFVDLHGKQLKYSTLASGLVVYRERKERREGGNPKI